MPEKCDECGAVVPAGETCQSNLHALLYHESEINPLAPEFFASTAGQTAHFFAISCYAIQHPRSMRYTVQAVLAARDSLAMHFQGEASLETIRARVRRSVDGKARVFRRDGDDIHDWGVPAWPVTVSDVLATAATPQAYTEATIRWARGTLAAIASADQPVTPFHPVDRGHNKRQSTKRRVADER